MQLKQIFFRHRATCRPLTCNIQKRESNVTTTTIVTEIPASCRSSNGALQMSSNPRAVSPLMVSHRREINQGNKSQQSRCASTSSFTDALWLFISRCRKDSSRTRCRNLFKFQCYQIRCSNVVQGTLQFIWSFSSVKCLRRKSLMCKKKTYSRLKTTFDVEDFRNVIWTLKWKCLYECYVSECLRFICIQEEGKRKLFE